MIFLSSFLPRLVNEAYQFSFLSVFTELGLKVRGKILRSLKVGGLCRCLSTPTPLPHFGCLCLSVTQNDVQVLQQAAVYIVQFQRLLPSLQQSHSLLYEKTNTSYTAPQRAGSTARRRYIHRQKAITDRQTAKTKFCIASFASVLPSHRTNLRHIALSL